MGKVQPKLLPSLDYLNEALTVDPERGTLTWKERPKAHFLNSRGHSHFKTRYAGIRADYLATSGYRVFSMTMAGKQNLFRAHRVIWKMVYGSDPTQCIDHIDQNRENNSISNLRDISWSENLRNHQVILNRYPNRAYPVGAFPRKDGKFCSAIFTGGRQVHLGVFRTAEEASAAFVAAATQRATERARIIKGGA